MLIPSCKTAKQNELVSLTIDTIYRIEIHSRVKTCSNFFS